MVSELRSRKIYSSDDKLKIPKSDRVNDKLDDGDAAADYGGGARGRLNMYRRLLDWDRATSLSCSICASPNSGHDTLRLVFKVLEIFGHGVPWIVVPVTLMYFSDDPWFLELILNLLAGIFLDLLVSLVLKSLVRRPRPHVNQNDMVLTAAVDSLYSFPSGHCTRVGMLVFFFMTNINLTVPQATLLLLLTVGIAASRIGLGRHYITDVGCGIIIGLLQGIFIQYYWMPVENLDYLKRYFIPKQ